ncbi:hypothetical protein [Streptomyces sp. SCL15-4]|uniref:hypothetical protein n=1 Tax=Streptomyces sp. SCL15-4 TaxID=2967221 RepID=UPI002966E7AC|nr:hypothetical protein [Streptomyces sp. SCL15-4]
MPAATHEPSVSCYKHGCKESGCLTAGRRYAKQLAYEQAHGYSRRTDATQARVHIHRLKAHGWKHRQIAAAAGIAKSTVTVIVNGQETTSKRNVLAILSIPIGPAPAEPAKVSDATGTTRRVRALAWMGYSLTYQGRRVGMTDDRISCIARGVVDVVRAGEARQIARLYRELVQAPGPSRRAATDARKKGWHGPLAWDAIDDPACEPETVGSVDRERRHKAVIDLELVTARTAQGRSAEEIAAEIGCHPRSIVRARRRAEEMEIAA